jgi:ubiquinone/menaquinone biosynthesis C-methylase UbiE
MATSGNPQSEHPSTYVVQDRSSEEELMRLRAQEQMVTTAMGGVLAEQPDPTIFQRVLDVGCGPGGWLLDLARAYPGVEQLIGVDISNRMIEYARSQAEEEIISGRLEYHVMDALRRLEFPERYFDLVNHRLAASWLRTWDWPGLLREYQRVCRPGGVIRVTEAIFIKESSSPALERLTDLAVEALYQAGHYFSPVRDAVVSQLERLLRQQNLEDVETRTHTYVCRAGTPEWEGFYDDSKRLFRTMVPFLQKWVHLPEDYDAIYQQALNEIQQEDFVGVTETVTAWGKKP